MIGGDLTVLCEWDMGGFLHHIPNTGLSKLTILQDTQVYNIMTTESSLLFIDTDTYTTLPFQQQSYLPHLPRAEYLYDL